MDQATFTATGSPVGAEPRVMHLKGLPESATMYAVGPEVIVKEVPEDPGLSPEEPDGVD